MLDDLHALKSGLPFVEMVSASVELRRVGADRYVCCCPWHAEKTPSCHIRLRHGEWRWHCFGCGESGDAIDWIARAERISVADAIRRLRRDYGALALVPPPAPVVDPSRGRAFVVVCDSCGAGRDRDVYAEDLPYVVPSLRERGWTVAADDVMCRDCRAGWTPAARRAAKWLGHWLASWPRRRRPKEEAA